LLISFALFLPFLAFFLTFIFGKNIDVRFSQYFTSLSILISSILSWIIFLNIIELNTVEKVHIFNWISSGDFYVDWSLRIDPLTSIMLIVITNVSAAVHFYSIGYMSKDPSIPRFMSYLSLFTFFMLALVTSDNLLQMFFGWEGVGLTSYLLIGFWYHKKSANKAAIKAFVVNRIGDFGFLLGIVGIFFVFNSVHFDQIFIQVDTFKHHKITFLNMNLSTVNLLCILLFIGAMGKSAQLGLHTWLPDAMEGPTPVSALIHAATMVTAGVFMVVRIIGASTAIFAATIALTQNDIKRVIAYSTCSQLGYMFFAAGLGAYSASIFHLMTHGFFKALLFLGAGSVIHSLNHEQDMKKMGGLSKKMPITTILMWIGSLSIIGFPFLSGYYSKESILEAAFFSGSNLGMVAYCIGILTAMLTAFYSWRLLFLTFHGKNRSSLSDYENAHESHLIMIIPLIFLALGSIFIGSLFANLLMGHNSYNFWGDSIITNFHSDLHLPISQSILSKFLTAFGILIALLLYIYKKELASYLSNKFKILYLISYNKWYIDEIYEKFIIIPSFKLSEFFWIKFDQNTIDFYGPNGISRLIKKLALISGRFQTGYLYHYAFVMLLGLAGFLTWYLYK